MIGRKVDQGEKRGIVFCFPSPPKETQKEIKENTMGEKRGKNTFAKFLGETKLKS